VVLKKRKVSPTTIGLQRPFALHPVAAMNGVNHLTTYNQPFLRGLQRATGRASLLLLLSFAFPCCPTQVSPSLPSGTSFPVSSFLCIPVHGWAWRGSAGAGGEVERERRGARHVQVRRECHTRTGHTRTGHTRTGHTRTGHTRTGHTRTEGYAQPCGALGSPGEGVLHCTC